METRFLFPNRFKKVGWMLLIPSFIAGVFFLLNDLEPLFLDVNVFAIYSEAIFQKSGFFMFVENNITDELIGVFLIIGAILIACSKEKQEDEFIAKIRLESLLWATYVNYLCLLIGMIFVYEIGFYMVMIFNMFTLLIFFLFRFNFILYKSSKTNDNEK